MSDISKGFNYLKNSDKFCNIIPHPRAVEIADYEFFWNDGDVLAPFGSDEGHISLLEVKNWIEKNPNSDMINCIKWIFSSWDVSIDNYNESILENSNILRIIQDYDFDELILSLDIVLIATGFGQLIVEGRIDENIKNIIHLAILRQMNSIVLDNFLGDNEDWKRDRFNYLTILLDILSEA